MGVERKAFALASLVGEQRNTRVQKQGRKLASSLEEEGVLVRIYLKRGVHCNKSHDRPEHKRGHNLQDTDEAVELGELQHRRLVEQDLDGSTSQFVSHQMSM